MKTLTWSVIVPFLNEEAALPACISALDSQTLDPTHFERIFIDNGSTDSSLEIVGSNPQIRLLHESARDPYLARNRGIAAGSGQYMVFLDADCIPDRCWLERLNEEINRSEADVLLGYLGYPQEASVFVRCYEDYYHWKLKYLTERGLLDNLFGHAGNMAIRADVFRDFGVFAPMPIVGDTEIIHRLLGHRPQSIVRYVPSARVIHLEVKSYPQLLRKLFEIGGYCETLARMAVNRTLPLKQKWQISRICVRDLKYGPCKTAALLVTLGMGWLSYSAGRVVRSCRMLVAAKNRSGRSSRPKNPADAEFVTSGSDARDKVR